MPGQTERFLVGLYSGAAADGVDAAVVALRGRREATRLRQVHHLHLPLPPPLGGRLRDLAGGAGQRARDLAEMDRELALLFARAARASLAEADLPAGKVLAVGCSGQAVCRLAPRSRGRPGAMLHLGCPAVLAQAAGLPVVAGFADGDAACGRRRSAWADWVLFRHRRLSRVTVHLGAVASIAFLGAGAEADDVLAFDAGPGTLLIDAVARELFARPFDDGGGLAAGARVCDRLLNELSAAGWFNLPPPKTLSPADWGRAYLRRLMLLADRHHCDGRGLLATVTELAARGVARSIAAMTERPHQVILSGGGAMNIHLAGRIRRLLSPSSTITVEKFGIGLRAKQAACQAVLAAAMVDAVRCRRGLGAPPRGLPLVGSITFPSRPPA